MKKPWLFAIIPGVMALVVIVFVVVILLVKFMWAWTIPDLFPGAVEQGLVAGTISWLTALKVALFVSILAGMAHGKRGEH